VDNIDRNDLLRKSRSKEQTQDRVPLVITYSSGLPNIHQILRTRAHILQNSERLQEVFQRPPLVAYRRGENLMDILVHRKTSKMFNTSKKNGMRRCNRKRCAVCKFVKEMDTLKAPDGKSVRINQGIDCQTKNVVYMASCNRCDKVIYVGETGTTLYQRTMNHLSSIRNNREGTPLAKHFNEGDHGIEDFMITGLEIPKEENVVYRRLRESYWIKKMKTVEYGENKKHQ